jgi:hypothetical protein
VTDQERELLANAARSLLLLQERVDALEIALAEMMRGNGPTITMYRLQLWSYLFKLKGQPSGYLDKIIAKARRD